MKFAEFKKAGHWPTLLAAFLYFDISFMAWVALGPLMVYIAHDMNLAVSEKFTLVAIPVLAGALLRVPMGILADIIGAKRTGIIAQLVVTAATAWVWRFGLDSKLAIEIFGLALGIGGASFAVALPQASRWYPPQYQGVVMGIAGAGNMGVVIDTMLAPSIAEHFGWQAVFGFLLIPMVLVFAYYALRGQGRAGRAQAGLAESLRHAVARPGQPLVHVLLLHHLRRLRRTCQRAAAVFHRAVPCLRRGGRPAGLADRRLRLRLPPGRRTDRRPHRRHPFVVDAVCGCRRLLSRHRLHAGRTGGAERGGLVAAPDAAHRVDVGPACSRSACWRSAWATARCFSSFRSGSVRTSA